jgi:hypothetical protein
VYSRRQLEVKIRIRSWCKGVVHMSVSACEGPVSVPSRLSICRRGACPQCYPHTAAACHIGICTFCPLRTLVPSLHLKIWSFFENNLIDCGLNGCVLFRGNLVVLLEQWHPHVGFISVKHVCRPFLIYRLIVSILFRIVFWDILPCKMIVDRRFRGTYCLHSINVCMLIPT